MLLVSAQAKLHLSVMFYPPYIPLKISIKMAITVIYQDIGLALQTPQKYLQITNDSYLQISILPE